MCEILTFHETLRETMKECRCGHIISIRHPFANTFLLQQPPASIFNNRTIKHEHFTSKNTTTSYTLTSNRSSPPQNSDMCEQLFYQFLQCRHLEIIPMSVYPFLRCINAGNSYSCGMVTKIFVDSPGLCWWCTNPNGAPGARM